MNWLVAVRDSDDSNDIMILDLLDPTALLCGAGHGSWQRIRTGMHNAGIW